MQNINKIEKALFDVTDKNNNMLIPWYLMAAYAYYVEDDPILTDTTFDKLAKKILDNWETIEHYHKHFLTKDMLEAGTYIGEYPSRVQDAVKAICHACR